MKNIYLSHNDNGKGRYDSHTVSINQPDEFFFIPEADISSYNLFDINGYGETKEEALKDLFNKLNYLFNEYKVLEKMLFETDVLTDNMIEVDCYGKQIVK